MIEPNVLVIVVYLEYGVEPTRELQRKHQFTIDQEIELFLGVVVMV